LKNKTFITSIELAKRAMFRNDMELEVGFFLGPEGTVRAVEGDGV
jgi:hypothetical protein